MTHRRVVVTGLGVVSSIGIGKSEFWQNLIAGKCGISDVQTFDAASYPVRRGGEVKDFIPTNYICNRLLSGIARASQFAIAASLMAIDDAGIDIDYLKSRSTGVVIGTTMADIQSLEQIDKYWVSKSEEDVWAVNISKYPGNALSDHVGFFFGLTGQNFVIPTACSAGNYSIGHAYDLVRQGKADAMLVGGADPFSRITFTGFNRLFAMAPEKCQPFDKNRKGMMVGEGAGILLVESLESAKKRDARIYAEILGYGLSCDAHHMTAPKIEGVAKVMEKAIKNAEICKDAIDYISAHGTGTPANDKTESEAIKKVFGDLTSSICVSSIKSMLGHTMGAASAIEAIACCLAVSSDVIPPTIHYETPDPECEIDCVPNRARGKSVRVALNNSFAFGGNNACSVFRKYL